MTSRVLLVLPANASFAPYVKFYLQVLEASGAYHDVIYWDRLGLDDNESWVRYVDRKQAMQRSFVDYLQFRSFIISHCTKVEYGLVIVFGIQLTFFLASFLRANFPRRFIVDIRDHHHLVRFFNLSETLRCARLTVISSPGFMKWLPATGSVSVCHNLPFAEHRCVEPTPVQANPWVISYVGALRDVNTQAALLHELGERSDFRIEFHGRGLATARLQKISAKYARSNSHVTGAYSPHDISTFYFEASMINVLIPRSGLNNQTLLPNRLYHAAVYHRPVLAVAGTHLAEVVRDYQLGLIVDRIKGSHGVIRRYIDEYDHSRLAQNSITFLEEVHEANRQCSAKLTSVLE